MQALSPSSASYVCVIVLNACFVCAESDSDDSDHGPARRRRLEAAHADDSSESQVCGRDAWHESHTDSHQLTVLDFACMPLYIVCTMKNWL